MGPVVLVRLLGLTSRQVILAAMFMALLQFGGK
jgi:hypothetical protein